MTVTYEDFTIVDNAVSYFRCSPTFSVNEKGRLLHKQEYCTDCFDIDFVHEDSGEPIPNRLVADRLNLCISLFMNIIDDVELETMTCQETCPWEVDTNDNTDGWAADTLNRMVRFVDIMLREDWTSLRWAFHEIKRLRSFEYAVFKVYDISSGAIKS